MGIKLDLGKKKEGGSLVRLFTSPEDFLLQEAWRYPPNASASRFKKWQQIAINPNSQNIIVIEESFRLFPLANNTCILPSPEDS